MIAESWRQGQTVLADDGLNLVCVFDCVQLPPSVTAALAEVVPDWLDFPRLLLVGNGGPRFWRALRASGFSSAHPVDDFSRDRVNAMADGYLHAPVRRWLYPGSVAIPLQRLGALAGWHHCSPLGIGINRRFGLWFAYRAALLIGAELPTGPILEGGAPCVRCSEKPCVQACPAAAVAAASDPDIDRCGRFRLTEGSPCEATCLARLACPVAPDSRYVSEQLAHHYCRSLSGLSTWLQR